MTSSRILVISLGHPELVLGGAPVVCQELFEELRERDGIQCTMLVAAEPASADVHRPGAAINVFDGRDGVYLLHQSGYDPWLIRNNDPELIKQFAEFLKGLRPDVLHFHHILCTGIDLLGVARQTLPACRIVLTLHEFAAICAADGHMVRLTDRSLCNHASPLRCHQCLPSRLPDEFLLRRMWLLNQLTRVDHFTTPSRFMIEHYVSWGIPRERISHVPNGQRSRVRRSLAASGRRFARFGYFGLLHDDKGVWVLLRAIDLLRGAGFTSFHVEINGGGIQHASSAVRHEIESFRAAEEARPSGDRVVSFNDSYDLEQIQSRMVRVDWTIVPSVWWEIFGIVISEAWMFGRPVICSNVGGMAERVTHEVNGLHFEMGDPVSLAATIRRAATEDRLWQRLHAAVPVPPSRAGMADDFLKLYSV